MMSARSAAGLGAMRAAARNMHKRDSLAKQKKGAGHWKPELASDSEEAVKADRASPGREDISKLQERTKRSAEELSRSGTSMRDGM
ncbi:hypothetical protein MAC_01844 [Metarhizium acridum CQMa 102]|uniref:Uncharacterized protein n=1 Tax=Metarhizium acridum (strain CQMa 102) TaxID=655827 RepID=E9DW46_METAQ|nr:uncharacterized protein MAC_01844 [Metarhizium acridum CQMa 102]EFY92243.1 hypothetical protein MAC_01844 [Metarhizium acridum CQMa 102]